MKKPEFKTHKEWFDAQFGGAPVKSAHDLACELTVLETQMRHTRQAMVFALLYEERFTASRYVWTMAQAGHVPKLKKKKNK